MWIDRIYGEEIMEPLWEGHRERLRLRMQILGMDRIKFHEQIEFLLYSIIPQVDLSDVARRIADKFGNLRAMMEADPDQFDDIPGVTPLMKEWLLIVLEIINAYNAMSDIDRPELRNLRDSINYISMYKHEVHPPESWIIFMDFEGQVVMHHEIAPSLSWAETEYFREVFAEALSISARSAVIFLFVGTLPLEIGDYEKEHLVPVAQAMRGIGIEILDLIYVGESGYLSLSRTPLMDEARKDSVKEKFHKIYLMEDEAEEA